MPATTTLLDARAMDRTLRRMADEIVELNDGTDELVIIGIQRRGVQLADRIARLIEEREGTAPRRGALDITLYRDDLQTVGPRPVVGPTKIPAAMDGARLATQEYRRQAYSCATFPATSVSLTLPSIRAASNGVLRQRECSVAGSST